MTIVIKGDAPPFVEPTVVWKRATPADPDDPEMNRLIIKSMKRQIGESIAECAPIQVVRIYDPMTGRDWFEARIKVQVFKIEHTPHLEEVIE